MAWQKHCHGKLGYYSILIFHLKQFLNGSFVASFSFILSFQNRLEYCTDHSANCVTTHALKRLSIMYQNVCSSTDKEMISKMVERLKKLLNTFAVQRSLAVNFIEQSEIIHLVELRVVREFNLPDNYVNILRVRHHLAVTIYIRVWSCSENLQLEIYRKLVLKHSDWLLKNFQPIRMPKPE